MNREAMIDEILQEVEDWDIETLIDWIQLEMLYRLKDMSDGEIVDNWNFLFGDEFGDELEEG